MKQPCLYERLSWRRSRHKWPGNGIPQPQVGVAYINYTGWDSLKTIYNCVYCSAHTLSCPPTTRWGTAVPTVCVPQQLTRELQRMAGDNTSCSVWCTPKFLHTQRCQQSADRHACFGWRYILVLKGGLDTWEWVRLTPFCWGGCCALLGPTGGDSDLDLCKGKWSRGLGLVSEVNSRGSEGEGRGERVSARTERVNGGSQFLSLC